MRHRKLTPRTYSSALNELRRRDVGLASVIDAYGDPPMWEREPGFGTLIHIILEQQVSLASARAAFDRLCQAVSPLTPSGLLELDDETLKAIGFSRQKSGYARRLSTAILEGSVSLEGLDRLDDEAVREALLRIDGVGPWTADIYLLMAMMRPDVWPAGDLALSVALQDLRRLDARPDPASMKVIAEPWKPWRAVAARVLWHYYLSS
jgi:DNA-3-methyladenine glycosylase II